MDIGKALNAPGFMDKEGNVLGSSAKLYNSREGFEEFINLIEGLKAKHHLRDVLIGMEPAGHYWRKLAYFAKDHGYEVRFVRTTALKHHRELYLNIGISEICRGPAEVIITHRNQAFSSRATFY